MIDFAKDLPWTEIAAWTAFGVIIGERIAAKTANKLDDKIFGTIHKILVFLKVKFPEEAK